MELTQGQLNWLMLLGVGLAVWVGLVSLWAARSRPRWYWRAAVLMGVIALFVWSPAGDLASLAAAEILVITVPLAVLPRLWAIARLWWRPADAEHDATRDHLQFSMLDMFIAVPLFAVLTVMVARSLRGPSFSPGYFVLCALAAGLGTLWGIITLATAWAALGQRKWPIRWATLATVVIATGLTAQAGATVFLDPRDGRSEVIRFSWTIILLHAGALLLILGTWRLAGWIGEHRATVRGGSVLRRLAAAISAALAVVLLVPLIYVYAELVSIPAMAFVHWPSYNELAALGSKMNWTDGDDVALDKLRKFVDDNQESLDQVQALMASPIVPEITFLKSTDPPPMNEFPGMVRLMGSLRAQAELAAREGRVRDAARIDLGLIQLGNALRSQGWIYQMLAGLNLVHAGDTGFCRNILLIEPSQCGPLARQLLQSDVELDDLSKIARRWRSLELHRMGWHVVLAQIVESASGKPNSPVLNVFRTENLTAAVHRLLSVELAIRAYVLDHGAEPDELNQLVGDYLAFVPIDPFSGSPLVYRRTTAGHVLYSVGPDGRDDGGQCLPLSDLDKGAAGDFFLESYEPPRSATNDTPQPAAASGSK